MSQACPSCLWITEDDDVEECERCGERFDGKSQPVVNTSAVGNVVSTVAGIGVLALLGFLIFQRAGGDASTLGQTLKTAAVGFYTWMLGPNEVLKPFLGMMLLVTIIIWVVLWLLARLQQ